ncbi:hypothetical protein IAR55_004448 [Kwoniella newhampshirensis]|uniref:BTB domain-containing protein n=1 Tax=Kwoniella newhampshirensis TaxID=1651941 RepID=A0AAW0YVD5_9TREE
MGNGISKRSRDDSYVKEKAKNRGRESCQPISEKTKLTRIVSASSRSITSSVTSTVVSDAASSDQTGTVNTKKPARPMSTGYTLPPNALYQKGDGDYTIMVEGYRFKVKEQLIVNASLSMKILFEKARTPFRTIAFSHLTCSSGRVFALALDLIYGRDLIRPSCIDQLHLYLPVIQFLKDFQFNQAIQRFRGYLQEWLVSEGGYVDRLEVFVLAAKIDDIEICATAIRTGWNETYLTVTELAKLGYDITDWGYAVRFNPGSSLFDISGMTPLRQFSIPSKYRRALLSAASESLITLNGSQQEWETVANKFTEKLRGSRSVHECGTTDDDDALNSGGGAAPDGVVQSG